MDATGRATIVAETGASHRGSYARSLALSMAAASAGCDAVKFSAFKPEEMTLDSRDVGYVIPDGPWKGMSLYDIYEQSKLEYKLIPDIKRAVEAGGMNFILSIYHPNTVPLAKEWGCRIIKISSFELGWGDLLSAIAKENFFKQVILSTGSATISEILRALEVLEGKNLTLLHCISAYPASPEDVDIHTMVDMRERFDVPVGLSDHTHGMTAAVAAVANGAVMVEKHIKLDDDGLDSSFALFPDRLGAMVQACRLAETMMGQVHYGRAKTYHRKKIDGRFVRAVW